MKVRTIIRTVEVLYGGYVITYGKAWRAKQRAWKMIYGDWEDEYEQLLGLFNTIKVVNLGMHYEYIPISNAWKDGSRYSSMLSGASLSMSRPLGTVILSSPLMVHS